MMAEVVTIQAALNANEADRTIDDLIPTLIRTSPTERHLLEDENDENCFKTESTKAMPRAQQCGRYKSCHSKDFPK
ncbi:unnamed protein product [Ceratitis capitata]|uniref:(Mediterranean fruit fly) hypothetical protein n=1 Tax=Ceratitis capitata TaxID=7213 RepID=A0A811UY92_CERCA|nr:unnamed protein product [Ceratitis capitata]